MALSQRSLQSETKKPPTVRSTFSLTDKLDKVISSFKSLTKTAPSHKGKESARSISLFPDVFATKTNTDDSPTRLPAGNWEGFFSSDSDNRIVMPYQQFPKEKRIYHSPFIWSFDEALAKHVASQSLFVIREAGVGPENQSYQIQPNREKIEKLRERIDLVFGMYYKLVFYHKIRINCSQEINQLKLSLHNINLKIDAERVFDYENATEELFTSMNIHGTVYEEFKHILESPIKENFIPTLMKLKKEFYAMEYLSGQHKHLEECLDTLIKDINGTIGIVYVLKKQLDVEKKLSVSPTDVAKFEKIQNPQDLYNAFVDLTVQIKALSNEANQFSKLRTMYRKYLKLAVILEVYTKNEAKLIDLKKRLFMINTKLQKKVESQNTDVYGLFRRATSDMTEVELPAEEFNVDLMALIDGEEECLQKPMIAEMKHHLITVEAFVRRAELFCEELASNKNPKKANKMQENSGIYILQVEKVIRAIAHAKKIMAEIKPIVESEFIQQQSLESIEKEVRSETRDIAYQIKQGNSALDLESWSSSKVMAAVNMAIQQGSIIKRSQKGNQKGIAFGRKRILKKLAQIIRDRTSEKNKVYLTCKSRVESSLSIGDSLKFFKSKRFWQAISSPKSHMVSIQSWSPDLKKLIHRKIYCNPELESYILRSLRVFVNSLAEMPQKHLP